MGADLYIQSQYAGNHAKWEKRFNRAVALRDRLTERTPEYERAQRHVRDAYERMYAQGYCRDSYNSSNLLRQFGLSWWTDVGGLLNKDRCLTPEKAAQLLRMLEARESSFAESLAAMERRSRRYFRAKYKAFHAFLEQAILAKTNIECSI